MQKINRTVKVLSIASAAFYLSFIGTAFAEAPVYDADAMQQSESEQGQELPPPPPPVVTGDQQDSGFVPMPKQAASPKISSSASSSVEQRLKRIEQQLNGLQGSDVLARTESLQNEIQGLRNQVEQLNHQVQEMVVQQKTGYVDLDKRYTDLDKRLSQLSSNSPKQNTKATDTSDTKNQKLATKASSKAAVDKPAADAQEVAAATADQPNVAEEQQIYQTAYNLIKAKRYNEAVTALQNMLKKYPSGQFAANAHYWLGELYGLMDKTDDALVEFSTVLKSFPDSPRVSDAQLKVGLIYATQSKWSDAKGALKKVINRYPGTASARLAAQQLKQIEAAGH